ncbi:MAG: Homocysteine S-methyltransferase, partial [Gammaproteobacteria bacterium]|nr:Homocysteine S-methyltransferase [Gammaproteobacteria bacterium]
RAWYDAGARLIGGCCRTTPDDIKAIYERYHAAR